MRTPFLGSAYTSRSSNLSAQRCINLYPELVETRDGKAVGGFYGVPGEDLLATVGTGPVRGLCRATSSVLYVVSGSSLYSVSPTWQATLLGAIGSSSGQVSMVWNGSQVAIFDGLRGYCWDGSSLSQISLPFTGPVSSTYQDGFGIVNAVNTETWYQSNYKDLKTWQALNFGTADAKPDYVVGIGTINREQWLFGEQYTEVWVDGGNSGFAFQRLQGVFMECGCVAPFSIANVGERLAWLGQGVDGWGVVYVNNGYREQRISTHAVEKAIQSYPSIGDAIGFCYQMQGHRFYVLTFPSGNATWVWDENTGLWHEWLAFVNGAFQRHDSNCYAFFGGRHVIGDWQSGNLYGLNLERYDDNGRPRKWLRSWRALPPNRATDSPIEFDSLRLDAEAGVTVPAGTNPQVALRWSDDGGNTWSNERYEPWGLTGQTAKRVKWRRLGQTRDTTGYDRVFEVSSSDPVRAALIGAVLNED